MPSSQTRGGVRPRLLVAFAIAASLALTLTHRLIAQQITPGSNVNMVSGTRFPTGDPFLQRQNEPSLAVSTRNPLHLLAGANDYRTVDIPGPIDLGLTQKMNADAWVGLFKSFDGGRTWQSTLIPGFPQDASPEGQASPIRGRQAATDPVVKAGTNGMFYYAGLAFDRGANMPSTIFLARFIDNNNRENGDPIAYLGTHVVASNPGARFLDKPAMAVDVPRGAATCSITTTRDDKTLDTQVIPAGNLYIAYSSFTGTGTSEQSQILFSRSTDCGVTWSSPVNLSIGNILNQNAQIAVDPRNGHVWVTWRRFKAGDLQSDGIFVTRSTDGGLTFSRSVRVAPVSGFDQGTTNTSFRTNAFQTMAVDDGGRVYVAWSERGYALERPDRATGDARIVVSTSTTGSTWSAPRPIDSSGLGHQIMPALTYHAGKLRLIYYDLREDVSGLFQQFIDELPILNAPNPKPPRHTIDAYVAQAAPGPQPAFTAVRLSDYAVGTIAGSEVLQRLQFNPPNLPLFRQGTSPFIGDYIDLAPAPAFVQDGSGVWQFNTAPSTSAVSHGVWTDNRDVRAPADGDWTNYTPVISDSLGTRSIFDSSQLVPPCATGQTGMRNQNIYTAKVTEGLFVAAPGNVKPLGSLQRAFVVLVENARSTIRTYRLQILNQPAGGQASFLQFSTGGAPLTALDASIPPFSTIARPVYVTSADPAARIEVTVTEITAPGGAPVAGGGQSSVVLNGDPTTPSIENPSIENPSIENPSIRVAEAYNPSITTAFLNPSIENPSIENPSIENPSIENPSIENPLLKNDAVANPGIINPSIENPSIENPSIENPSIENPSIENTDLVNGSIDDTTWIIRNDGNTTASYAIKLLTNSQLPSGFKSQLILHKTYRTPTAQNCELALQPHTILIASIPNPTFTQLQDVSNPSIENPSIENPTISLAPGESANVTLRVVDPNRFDGVEYDAGAAITPAAVAHSVNTEDVAQGITTPRVAIPLTITTGDLASATPGGTYSQSLQTFASVGTTNWTVTQGSLPPGVTLDPATGQLSGTPTTPGQYVFVVQATDGNGNVDRQTLSIKIDPIAPAGFSRVWNGVDNNWNNPKNWSPAGVPTAIDNVYISSDVLVSPRLTSNATINHLVVESGASLDTDGFTLTTLGNVDAGNTILGTGTVVMSGVGTAVGTFPNLTIHEDVLLAGPLLVTGNLTILAGGALNLLGHPATVAGQLIANATGALEPLVVGGGGALTTGGVDVDGLRLSHVLLTISGGTLTQFDRVRFIDYDPEDVHLTINHPGTTVPVAMTGLTFFTLPTSGRYIQANDTSDNSETLTVNVLASLPAEGETRSATQGGAVINWEGQPGSASLAVTQYRDPNVAIVGLPLTYTILVTNGGPATATGVTLDNPLPAGVSFGSAASQQGTCGFSENLVSCSLGSVLPGQTIVVTIVVTPTAPGTLNNSVTVTGAETDPTTSDNVQTVSTPVVASATVDVSLTKSDSADPVTAGQPFTYTLVVGNAGPGPASNVLVLDELPAGVTASAATSTRGTCSIAGSAITCSLGSLPAGAQETVTITATATGSALITNTAVALSPEADTNPANNSASETTLVGLGGGCPSVSFLYAGTNTTLAGPVSSLKIADMNEDGVPDAVMVHQGTPGAVSLVLFDVSGSDTITTVPVNAPVLESAVADVNGDGHLDVVAGTSTSLRVLLGDGAGGLTETGAPVPVGAGFVLIAFDQDGDGDVDLLSRGTAGDLVLFRNGGTGSMAAPVSLLSDIGTSAVTGDFNGDSLPDIAVAHASTGFSVLLANGAGGFAPATAFATAAGPRLRAVGDINADGRLDLAITTGSTANLTSITAVRLGNGSGGFGPELAANTGGGASQVVAGDVNGDGKVDLVARHAPLSAIGIQLGDGSGGFAPPVFLAAPTFSNPAIAEVDGSGRPEIFMADSVGTLRSFINTCGQPPVDLGLSVTESADPVDEGQEVAYTLTLRNDGASAATDVRVTMVTATTAGAPGLFSATSSASIDGELEISGNSFTWQFPSLAAGQTATIGFRVTPDAGGLRQFTATVTSEGGEIDAADNTVFETTTVNAVSRDLVVTNTNNAGTGSLRQALLQSNADSGDTDRIVFSIGTGPQTITPLTPLPTVTQPVVIDGRTQPGFSGAPIIEIAGNGLGGNGLTVTGGTSTVRGLVVNSFGGTGILMTTNGGNVIAGNYVGTDSTGTIARPNGNAGIQTINSSNNIIGGTSAGDRNLVSGGGINGVSLRQGSTNNRVQGNYIGVTANGTAALGNGGSGVVIGESSNNIIGGTEPGAGNLLSGNGHAGVLFVIEAAPNVASGNLVQGNLIGTDPSGTTAIPNVFAGINVAHAATGNTIGGTTGAARNVISGNGRGIQLAGGASGNLVQGNYIGTTAAGNVGLPNTGNGVVILGGAINNTIGGTTTGARNLISGNTSNGVRIEGTGSTGNVVQGNYIGINAAGAGALPNSTGVSIVVGPNQLGGTASGAGNVISGNTFNNVVLTGTAATGVLVSGNLIGPNAAGTSALSGGATGIQVSAGATLSTIGGTDSGARNLISGNATGIMIDGATTTNIQVLGNYIGTNADGTGALANTGRGVVVQNGASGNTIGGPSAGARNVISGNAQDGVLFTSTTSNNLLRGNFIGTNASGTLAVPNGLHGFAGAGAGHTIGGATAGAGNLISGNTNNGIALNGGAANVVIQGNLIGTNGAGTAAIPNGIDGVGLIQASSNNTIGGTAAAARNVISGNVRHGIGLFEGSSSNIVEGNLIGTQINGTVALANGGAGVSLGNSNPSNNRIGGALAGQANVIAFNGGDGIEVFTGTGNRMLGNSIHGNGGLGIDLSPDGVTANDAGDGDAGANQLQNFPAITSAVTSAGSTTIQGTLQSVAGGTYRVEVFSNSTCDATSPNGEGQTFAGATDAITDGSGNAAFSLVVPAGAVFTATATSSNGDTSEFSVCFNAPAAPALFTVTTTNDSGPGSLRQAILDANASVGTLDTIRFQIGDGAQTITPQSELPIITDPVVIDGTTQPGFAGTPIIELDGSAAGAESIGLRITAGGSTVRGLIISGFGPQGIGEATGIGLALLGGGNNLVEGNYIGTNPGGTQAKGNRVGGIYITGPGNVIGGTTALTRNVISGNGQVGVFIEGAAASGNQIKGNFIGTSASGLAAIPNLFGGIGIEGAANNTIGGAGAGAGNVISGNQEVAVAINATGATGNIVAGNLIGVDATGTAALPNGLGVAINGGAANNLIGGTSAAARNVISGNQSDGVLIEAFTSPYPSANLVQGNYIGLNAAGTAAIPNGLNGVEVSLSNTGTATGNVIGGTADGAGNVISGNGINGVILHGPGTQVQGNFIGTNPAGTAAIPNGVGVQLRGGANVNTTANLVGGTVSAARNVISGNTEGLLILNDGSLTPPSANTVQRNYIGVNAPGTAALPNGGPGVNIFSLSGAAPTSNTIGGSSANGNVISGNTGPGVRISAGGNTVSGNTIGLRPDLAGKLANGAGGVDILGATNIVGGGTGFGNIVTGNTGAGVRIAADATGTIVRGNIIGGNPTGETAALTGNTGDGILVQGNGTTIGGSQNLGQHNVIHRNGGAGVRVTAGLGHSILFNSIHANTGRGIDLGAAGVTANDAGDPDTGANGLQNFPLITSAVVNGAAMTIAGTLNSTPNGTFRIQFFTVTDLFSGSYCDAGGHGEGQHFIGETNVATNASGEATINVTLAAAAGEIVTATATAPDGSTSEFSACRTLSQTFLVTNTLDSGAGSLRQAILNANARPGLDVIGFNVPAAGVQTISPGSFLPVITDPVIIDGTTQPGYAGTPLIELDGTNAGGNANGLHFNLARGNTVRALAINRFGTGGSGLGGAGIAVISGGLTVIEASYIGVDPSGTLARPNRTDGIWVDSPDNRIGGPSPAQRNIISGNSRYGIALTGAEATLNTVAGNYIGLNAAGTAAVPNGAGGVVLGGGAFENVIGGETSGPLAGSNVISGNLNAGIELSANGNFVRGNVIGLRADLSLNVPNSGSGILIAGSNNTIGPAAGGLRNIITGNGGEGIRITSGSGNIIRGNVIGGNPAGLSEQQTGNGSHGIFVNGSNTVIGGLATEGNLLQGNGGDGVRIAGGTGNSILFNVHTANDGLAIDLAPAGVTLNDAGDADTGANNLQNNPQLLSATTEAGTTTVTGTLNSTPGQSFRIQFYVVPLCDPRGSGGGLGFLGETTTATDGGGNASFTVPGLASTQVGNVVTATATDSAGNTSEFSGCTTVTAAAPVVTWITDGDGLWENPANWSTGQVPQPGEAVVIDRPAGAFTITVQSASAAVASLRSEERVVLTGGSLDFSGPGEFNGGLTVSGGVLLGSGNITLDGMSTWTGGNIQGTGQLVVRSGATLQVNSPGQPGLMVRSLINDGTITWNQLQLGLSNGASISNNLGAVFEFQSNLPIVNSGGTPVTITNAGTMTKSGPGGPIILSSVDFVTTGTLRLRLGEETDAIVSDRPGTLGGTLDVRLQDGFALEQDAEFFVLSFSARTGTFETIQDNGATYSTTYTTAGLILTAQTSNLPPIANAGPDQQVAPGATVQLDGGGSSDPEDSPLTFTWILNTRPAGSAAVLSATNVANPTFIADVAGTYIAQLLVNDGLVNSASDTVTITTANQPPVAHAGPDQAEVPVGATVTLNGTGSNDPEGQNLTYAWSFVLKPGSSGATLSSPTAAQPTFVADRGGRYRLQLVVNDGQANSLPDTVDIVTVNQPPTANAGPDQTVLQGGVVQLNGTASSDPDSNPLTYSWTLPVRPNGSTATIGSPSSSAPTFVADVVGAYTARLVVNDGFANSAADDVVITANPAAITMTLVGTPLVGVGGQATLRVTLPTPAPTGGVQVTVTSANTNVVTVGPPDTVAIAQGSTTGQLTLNGVATGATTVNATAPGYQDGALSVTVSQNVLSVPATLNVPFGQTASLPISIPQPAPAGGIVVSLASSAPATVEVLTPTVTIPQGALSANGSVRGLGIGSATVSATNPDFSTAASLVSSTGGLNITQGSVIMTPNFPQSITIQLTSGGSPVAAPPGGVSITLTPANAGCIAAPGPVSIGEGLVNASVELAYGGSAALPCNTTVTATATALTQDSVAITVNPNPGITLFSLPTAVGGGLQNGAFTVRLGESQHGGIAVTLTSSDPAIMKLSPASTTPANPDSASITLNIPNGQTDATYYIQGMSPTLLGTATITASAPGFTGTQGTVNIVQPTVALSGPSASTTTLSTTDLFFVALGVADQNGNFLISNQAPRAGTSLIFTVTNSNGTVAELVTSQGSHPSSRTVTVAGSSFSASSIAAGGIAFDPKASGSTQVGVSAPNFNTVTASTVSVTVSAPGITLFSLPASVGGGLQNGAFTVRLGASNHGGVSVTLTSSDPAMMKLSPNSTTPANPDSASITLNIPNGQTDASYYIQGMSPTQLGTATVTASAPGFSSTEGTVNIVQPTVALSGPSASTTTLSTTDLFFVALGVADQNDNFLISNQAPRAGTSLSFTVTNSNGNVAELVTSQGSHPSSRAVTVTGSPFSASSVASGGIAFDPIGGGTTQVAVSAPNFNTVTASTVSVTVSAPGITLFSLPATVGGGLQNGAFTVRLGASNHGGVSVTLTSSDPAMMKLSPNSTTPANPDSASITLNIPNGFTDASYYIQGMSPTQLGTATVTASAPGFNSTEGNVTIVQPTVALTSLSTSTTTLSTTDLFFVALGVADQNDNFLISNQAPRAGTSLGFTVTNSNGNVAELVTSQGSHPTSRAVTVTGSPFSANSVAAGGIAFDPIGGGTTQVAVSAPSFNTVTASTVSVTVSAPGITLFSLPATVGGGLQNGAFTVRLGASNHGGVTLTLTSSSPTIMKLSPNSTTPANPDSASITLNIPNGQTDASYYIQGMSPTQLGTVTVTASAPGFSDATAAVTIVAPAVALASLPATTSTASGESLFHVSVGLPSSNNTSIASNQAVRAGTSLVATVTNSNGAAADIRTLADGPGQTRQVTIPGASSFSPNTLGAGGITFVPKAAGGTSLSVTAPSFQAVATSTASVTVTAPGIALLSAPDQVGAGLQSSQVTARLGGAQHGGVTLRIASSDSSVALVSGSASAAGAALIDVNVPNGTTDVPFFVQGTAPGTLGNVTITASITGFTPGTDTVEIVQPALDLSGLPASIAATGTTAPFVVRTGIANSFNTAIQTFQNVRAGSPVVVTVSLTHNPPSVVASQLVTSGGGDQTRTVTIQGNTLSSPSTVASGGIAFDPLQAGSSEVRADATGFTTTAAGIVTVSVTSSLTGSSAKTPPKKKGGVN